MKNLLAIVVAVGLGLAAVVLVRNYIEEARAQAIGPMVEVILIREELSAGTQLGLEHLAKEVRPRMHIDPDTVPSSELQEVLGQRLLVPKSAKTLLRWPELREGPRGVRGLADLVPSGKRAVTLTVDTLSGFSGMLRPGDKVDILLQHTPANEFGMSGAPKTTLELLLSNLTVLALDRTTGRELRGQSILGMGTGGEGVFGTVTFAVRPIEAELLIFSESQGQLRFVLRNPGDEVAPEGVVALDTDNYRAVMTAVATGK